MLEDNNNEMDRLDREIETTREEVEDARSNTLVQEGRWKVKEAQIIFQAKADKLNDSSAKAKATIEAVDDYNAYLIADAKYRGCRIRLDTLVDKKESLKERNFNERAAMKCFGG